MKKLVLTIVIALLAVITVVICFSLKSEIIADDYLSIFNIKFVQISEYKEYDENIGDYYYLELHLNETDRKRMEVFLKRNEDKYFKVIDKYYYETFGNINYNSKLKLVKSGYYSVYDYEMHTYNLSNYPTYFTFFEYSDGIIYLLSNEDANMLSE